MAKRKAGSIAVPFLITVFVGLIVIGGAAFGIYNYFGFGEEEGPAEPIPRQIVTSTYEDNHTIFLILDEPDQKCPCTFLLMRSIPKDKKILFFGIPTNTIALVDGKQQSLRKAYESGGATAVVTLAQQMFEIEIDRYMKLDSDTFVKVCDLLGGVTYPVTAEIAGFSNDGAEQYLSGSQIETLVTYPLYDGGEVERAYISSSLASNMVNQADGKRVADQLDTSFNTIINMLGNNTNVTAVDYKNRKAAIKNMFERGNSIATFIVVDGTIADSDFILNSTFVSQLKEQYFNDDVKK